jgi:hypothetical protein
LLEAILSSLVTLLKMPYSGVLGRESTSTYRPEYASVSSLPAALL